MDAAAAAAPCELLAWDSQHFGRVLARLVSPRLDRGLLSAVERWCAEHGVDGLYFLADPEHPPTAPLAEAAGFRLVDVRVTLGGALPAAAGADGTGGAGIAIRPSRPEDVPALAAIAAVSHTDSRFYYDPHFPRERSDALYATWIERSCRGEMADAVLVAEVDGRPAGYITCRLPEAGGARRGEIGLLAAAAAARGRGVGSRLVAAALGWLAEQGAGRVSVVTQGRNVRAQRLYQRHGLVTERLELWFHRWFADG
jgi:dTDP-4-amino-4,6-dideoxy-D-galactose acyltransferase